MLDELDARIEAVARSTWPGYFTEDRAGQRLGWLNEGGVFVYAPRAIYEAMRDVLPALPALLRVARAAAEHAAAEDAQAGLKASHYPSEPPEDEAADAWERLENARSDLRAALEAVQP